MISFFSFTVGPFPSRRGIHSREEGRPGQKRLIIKNPFCLVEGPILCIQEQIRSQSADIEKSCYKKLIVVFVGCYF